MTQQTIAANIRRIIQEKALIQRKIAERAGFTAQRFNDMLHGRKVIKAEYIPSIADALGAEISDLFMVREEVEV